MARLAVMVALTLYPWVTGFAAVTACIESAEFKWTTGLTDRDQAKLNDHNAAIARGIHHMNPTIQPAASQA
jgi:hypothetical protein